MLTAGGMLPTEQPARLRPGGRQRRTTRQRGAGVLGVGRVLVVPRGGGEQLAWPRSCQATATAPTSTQHPRPFRTWNVSTTATVTRADPGRQVHATAPHTAWPELPLGEGLFRRPRGVHRPGDVPQLPSPFAFHPPGGGGR